MNPKNKFDVFMMLAPALAGLCSAEGEGDDPPADPPKDPPPKDPPNEEQVTLSKSAFERRIEQAKRAGLRDAGIDPEQVKKDREQLAALQKKEEERAKAAMTEQERLKVEKEEADKRAKESEARATAAEQRAELVALCAKHGIRDVDYAMFRLSKRDEGVSADEFITEALKDDTERSRFGVAAEGTPPPPKKPTSGGKNEPPPKPGDKPPEKPVSQMSPQEFAEYKRRTHGL